MRSAATATLLCLAMPAAFATLLTATGTGAAITLGLATTGVTTLTAANSALAVAATGAAAVVGALAAGALLDGHHRYKRDIGSVCSNFDNEELLFILAANSDQLGCGQRLVCELEASKDTELSTVEQSIVELFGRNPRPLKASQMHKPKSLYHYAAQVGSKASSSEECAEVFDLCPLDRAAIMDAYNSFAHAVSVDEE